MKHLFLGILFLCCGETGWAQNNIKTILDRYAQDYQSDPSFTKDRLFGVSVGNTFWTVELTTASDMNPSKYKIQEGKPVNPTFYYEIDQDALQDLDAGKINILTGAVKAFSNDFAPVEIKFMEGFIPEGNFSEELLPFTFHFWTRGYPEIVPYGPMHTRATHGAQATIFYYQKGIRFGYSIIHPGQHANENPKSRENEFPSFFILISGKATFRLDGKDYLIEKGQALFVPQGVNHEIINHETLPAEIILLMFGEGA